MKKKLDLLFEFLKLSIKQSMIFRGTWLLGVLGQFLNYGATILSLYIVILSLGSIKGWTAGEMLFIYALSLLAYALAASVFYGPCMVLGTKILNGDFDQTLTKPMNALTYEIVSNFNIGYISHIILGTVLVVIAVGKMSLEISVITVTRIIIIVICGAMLQASLMLFASMFSFIMVNGNPALQFIVSRARNFIQYPLNIYPKGIQLLLTFVLPYGFINFYPVVNLLHKQELAFGGSVLGTLFPIISVLLFIISILAWNKSLKVYSSAGA